MAHWVHGVHAILERLGPLPALPVLPVLPALPRPGVVGPVLARGVVLGLGAAVPIGPVNVQIARRALRHGFLAGFALGCGAVTADITYAALSSLSFAGLLNRPPATQIIAAAGVLLLAYLGLSCLRAAGQAWRIDPLSSPPGGTDAATTSGAASDAALHASAGAQPGARSGYVTGLLMTLLNPMTLAFWFTVVPATASGAGGASVADVVKQTQDAGGELPITCAGVFIGTLAWVVTFAGLLARAARPARAARAPSAVSAGRSHRNGWLAAADAAGGVTLLAFAGLALWRLVRPFL